VQTTESRRITIGPASAGPPVYTQTPVVREDKWDYENGVLVSTFWQYVSNTYVQEHFVGQTYTNPTYSGGSVYAHNTIDEFKILNAGTGYTTIPTLTSSAPPAGAPATGTVTSLKLTEYTVTSYGSGYALNNVVTLVGGAGTAATLTVSGMGLTSASLLALGSGYIIGDQITLSGGINTSPAIVSVATSGVSAFSVTAAGTGVVAGTTYEMDVGGTASQKVIIEATYTKAVSVAYVSGGTASPDGFYQCKGTTGTGVFVGVTIQVTSGVAVSATITPNRNGRYTGEPPHLNTETLQNDTGPAMSTYPIISMVMGIHPDSQIVTTSGSYSVIASSLSELIKGIAITPTWGVSTVTVDNAGSYTTSLPSTLYQLSTTGVGIGATFNTFTWTPNALTISSGGAYTAIANGNCATTGGAGIGLTLVPSFGIGTITKTYSGTGYRTAYPPAALSYGNATISANPDAKAIYTGPPTGGTYTSYITSSQIVNTEHALIKKSIWVVMSIPFATKSYASVGYNFPAIFSASNVLLDRNGVGTTVPPPTVGYDYGIIPSRSALFPARLTKTFSIGQQAMPAVFSLYSYQSQTKYYPQLANCSHSQFNVRIWRTDKDGARTGSAAEDVLYEERVPPSSPTYFIGSILTIQVSQKPFKGNIWEMEVTEISEYPLL
jgi:hypothetical protein